MKRVSKPIFVLNPANCLGRLRLESDAGLTRIERILKKITVEIEDEFRIVLKHRLKENKLDKNN